MDGIKRALNTIELLMMKLAVFVSCIQNQCITSSGILPTVKSFGL